MRPVPGKWPFFFVLLAFCFAELPNLPAADSNTALTAIEVVGAGLLAVEGINLIVRLLKKIPKIPPKPKKPKIRPDLNRYKDLFTELTNIQQPTNAIVSAPSTNLASAASNIALVTNLAGPATNLFAGGTNLTAAAGPGTNILMTKLQQIAAQAVLSNFMVRLAPTNRIITNMTTRSVFSNLTPTERQDVILFGWDHYYLVAFRYYEVKKYDKAREFMFHSIAIGMMIEEGTAFLKKNYGLTDLQIGMGARRYQRTRE